MGGQPIKVACMGLNAYLNELQEPQSRTDREAEDVLQCF